MTAPVSVLQEIPVPTLVLDAATGCLRAANPAMCELAGWAAQEVASCSLSSLQLWDDPMEVSHMLRQLQDGAALVGYPCRIRRGSDRLAVLVHGAFSVLEGAACITLCFTDVSEYLDAQRVTQAHEALISRGLGAASVATWEWDAASGAFAFSAHWDSMLGHPRNDAVPAGGVFTQLLHPEDRSKLAQTLARCRERGEPLDLEIRLRSASGDYRWCRMRSNAPAGLEGCAPTDRLAGVLGDTAEQRDEEMTRRRIQERLAIATSTVGISTWEVFRDGMAVWDAQTYRLYGRDPATTTPPEVIYRESLDASELARTSQWMRDTMRSHTYSTIEFPIRWPDGQVRWLAAKGKGLTGPDGKVISLLGVNWDITEQKASAQSLLKYQQELWMLTQTLMEQEKQTSQRLAMALHDRLGQTLAALRLNLDTLQILGRGHAVTTAQTQRMQALMDQAAEELRDVLMHLRSPILEEQGLGAALENEIEQTPLRTSDIRLVLKASPAAMQTRWPPAVEYGCFMIAREALTNALKHAQASCIVVELRNADKGLQVDVTDDGVGMPCGDAVMRPGHLGLISMRERALAIGARLSVAGAPDTGTRIQLRWEAGA